uniref:Hemicentin-1-like isoform X2 n=1 Tax=Crassostrea virginica TaxID=6565 RepID=A0A8B8D9B8_CRAVI|nr:hemicentin-1-like isoform X2 [Crassostrea virginica]
MNFGFFQPIFHGLLCSLGIAYTTGSIILTVTPSNEVAVNQRMTLLCEFDSNPIVAQFNIISRLSSFCQLEGTGGTCLTTDCSIGDNASCPSNTRYSLQVTVPQSWNGETVFCQSAVSSEKSNNITFRVTVPVSSVTLLPEQPITMIAEQQMNLNCTTSACNPSANIQWLMSSENITSHSSSKITPDGGLFRTVSSLNFTVKKQDNQKQVFCRASNIPSYNVTSSKQTLHVLYKPEVKSISSSPYAVIEGQTATLGCTLINANPNTGITWRWIKTDSPSTNLHTGPNYTISNIQRGSLGSFNCTASNAVGTSEPATTVIYVLYKPEVMSSSSSPYAVNEGQTATLVCTLINANPNTGITWRWIKTDSPSTVLHTGPNYTIPNIQRGRSGSYSCTATNTVGTSEPATTVIDVLYKPDVMSITLSPYSVIEGQTATLVCTLISANPNTGITWRWIKTDSPSTVLHTGPTYTIPNIQRGRSGSYNCTATNTVGTSEAATIYVDVLYKPSIEERDVMIVNETERVVLTRTISSNPLSDVSWFNRTQLLVSETFPTSNTSRSVTTMFTIHNARCTDTKNFTVVASNALQENITSRVELIVNWKPDSPRIGKVSCNVNSAKIEWISSFNGGNSQTFFALGLIAQEEVTRSEAIKDRGENKIHNTELLNLQPSTKYVFYVVSKNKLGNSSSNQMECKTLEDINDQTAVVAGSVGGTLTLGILMFITVFLIHRRYTFRCSISFEKRNRNNMDKTNQEASHYTSMAEPEQSERNMYDELTSSSNVNQYEAVLMKGQEENTQMYEKLQHINDNKIEDQDLGRTSC